MHAQALHRTACSLCARRRAAFDKLDLNGNGVIEAFELKEALLSGAMKDAAPELIDTRVGEMMRFADTITPDGEIDFDEYPNGSLCC